jgi:putative DNA topoisomerase
MKKLIILVAAALVASSAAFAQTKAGKIDNTKHPIVYACPVNETVITRDLTKCPFCGMDLNLSQKEQIKTAVAKAHSCPLLADITADKAGRKLNVSPKEEMKMRVVGLDNSNNLEERKSVAKQ